ncbi:uncharacterized protein METZ01_LOCUS421289 [marine metagenome]|uniref:Uncharacterized protein n=1 Tax=marine metagenome TaxID=408172 RepID=A0A382XCX2_9ZZZZ
MEVYIHLCVHGVVTVWPLIKVENFTSNALGTATEIR